MKNSIRYDDSKKDLPSDRIEELFVSAGWSDGKDGGLSEFMNVPFINSTLVISAWDAERLVGVVRALSDRVIRSVIYDLVVLPEYKGRGIGKELVKRCVSHFPNSEWSVYTEKDISPYYEKLGFAVSDGVFLTIPSIYQ